ncbi:MAG: class I SAM-dependent methyltransferase [Dehalococcoidales bacterium]|jgi:SAM-dependent methyltransferase|nr:class I SAM-dependent methyltransferase [Dehalococcoidales bacterium]MDD3264736.1 class I SAM-dependent methyltransferase [Dehalococcoidales bacterium]MDD4322339.1 class I SAM-dependent methyltransferase [Dehalococcoidales bacterium]MDD4794325.1 class I SAM-dependent methyltransferase [Dehalococcoidales bacterium]MDD5122233.1 class I SAM-dependent methyltransferase [Dehalococcoidales bacterium]
MEKQDLIRVNQLWKNIYPYLVKQVMEAYSREEGEVLELGPFSGGISLNLARNYPSLRITIADERREMLAWFRNELESEGMADKIKIARTDLNRLDFASETCDLVIIRGAFFFLSENPYLLSEIYRVLTPGGIAVVGGGYGKDTPQELMDEIADESRVLNQRLGRKWLSIETLKEMVSQAGLEENTRIWEEGGVWLVISR